MAAARARIATGIRIDGALPDAIETSSAARAVRATDRKTLTSSAAADVREAITASPGATAPAEIMARATTEVATTKASVAISAAVAMSGATINAAPKAST